MSSGQSFAAAADLDGVRPGSGRVNFDFRAAVSVDNRFVFDTDNSPFLKSPFAFADYSWVVGLIVSFILYWALMRFLPARETAPASYAVFIDLRRSSIVSLATS